MAPDNLDIKYKDLFRKNEEGTGIPEFEDILNRPVRQKKHSGKSAKIGSAMILCLALVTGIFYYRDNEASKKEATLFQDEKSLVWEWKSPTQQLLSQPMSNSFTGFNLPTDCLSPPEITLQTNNNK